VRIGNRKTLTGTVTSDRMEKTITVLVERRYKHPKYGKYIVASRKYAAHDESNDARIGDTVELSETRPLSKSKRWRLLQVVTRAPLKAETRKAGSPKAGTPKAGTPKTGARK